MQMYIYTYMLIYNIHQLHAVTTNRIQVARALCLGALVTSVPRLPITLAGALNTAHQSTIALCK